MDYDEVKYGRSLIPSGGGFCGHCCEQPCQCDRIDSERRDQRVIAGDMSVYPDMPEYLNFKEVSEALSAIDDSSAYERLELMKKHLDDPIFIKKMSIVVASKEALRQYNIDHDISAYMSRSYSISNHLKELSTLVSQKILSEKYKNAKTE